MIIGNQGLMERVKKDPASVHWSQSPQEKVDDIDVKVDIGDFILTETSFLAPKLVNYTTERTEDIGETSKDFYVRNGNLESFLSMVRWFNESFAAYYTGENFQHPDYTLWLFNLSIVGPTPVEIDAFANLRIYPEESFFVDFIRAEFLPCNAGDSIAGGYDDSYVRDPHLEIT